MVTGEAGVSRGAMLHHFPTKVDLMIAVGEDAATTQNRYVRRRLNQIDPGRDRFLALAQATWEAVGQPPALPMMEIMIARAAIPAWQNAFHR